MCSDGTGTVKNTAVIRGVRPGEKCRWRVGDESGVFSDSAVFRAPELDEGKLTFLVMTDSQDGENRGEWLKFAWHDAVRRFPEARLLVNAGDIVQEGGSAEMWAQMFGINEEFLRSVPMAPVAGNHDYWYGYLHGFDAVCEKHFNIDLPPGRTHATACIIPSTAVRHTLPCFPRGTQWRPTAPEFFRPSLNGLRMI